MLPSKEKHRDADIPHNVIDKPRQGPN